MSCHDDTDADGRVMEHAARIAKLERTRIAYKGSLTKRLNQLSELVVAGASRTKIRFLQNAMLKAFEVQKENCEQLYGEDRSFIGEEQERIDAVMSEVADYFESRKDEAETRSSLVSEWVKRHRVLVTTDEGDMVKDQVPEVGGCGQKRAEINMYVGNVDTTRDTTSNGYVLKNSRTKQELMHDRGDGVNNLGYLYNQQSDYDMVNRDELWNAGVLDGVATTRQEVSNDYIFLNTSNNAKRKSAIPELPQVGGLFRAVDAWIDDLSEEHEEVGVLSDQSEQAIMALFAQQTLPRISLPKFDGKAEK